MDWPVLSRSMAEYFSELTRKEFTPDSVLELFTDSEALYLGPIDWVWGTEAEISNKLDGVKAAYAVKSSQVELLLSEAGALFERSLADLLKYDELNVERL